MMTGMPDPSGIMTMMLEPIRGDDRDAGANQTYQQSGRSVRKSACIYFVKCSHCDAVLDSHIDEGNEVLGSCILMCLTVAFLYGFSERKPLKL